MCLTVAVAWRRGCVGLILICLAAGGLVVFMCVWLIGFGSGGIVVLLSCWFVVFGVAGLIVHWLVYVSDSVLFGFVLAGLVLLDWL